KFVNNTYYSTNPRISYRPESQCTGGIFGSCGKRYDPWEPSTYTSSENFVETFFKTSNWQNQPDTDQIRHVSFGFRGTAIYIYGAPRANLQHPPGLHEVCLGFSCTRLQVAEIYDTSDEPHDKPLLLWFQEGLNPTTHQELQFRFLEPNSDTLLGMTFHHLVLTEASPAERPEWRLRYDEEFFDVTYQDTNPRISYSPSGSWEFTTFSPDREHNQSFHHTSSWGHHPEGDGIRTISWNFKGVSISVYGAPKSQLQYNPGHAEMCINGNCHPIDTTRLYNNAPSDSFEPVLLYSYNRLDPGQITFATLRFLQKESPIPGAQKSLTFFKTVFSQVRKERPIIPGTTFVKQKILDNNIGIDYLPVEVCTSWFWGRCTARFNPWSREFYPNLFGTNDSYSRTSTWLNELSGSDNRRAIYHLPC
ncbi:hypothetical protein FRC02_006191, partial [Tulasnella sp. 418]